MTGTRPHRAKQPAVTHDPNPITDAKAHAFAFSRAVRGRDPAEIRRITAGMDREHLIALAVVFAEAVRPGELRLLQIVKGSDGEDEADAA